MKNYIIIYLGIIAIIGFGVFSIHKIQVKLNHEIDFALHPAQYGGCPLLRNGWIKECDGTIHRLERRYRKEEIKQCVKEFENYTDDYPFKK